MPSRHGFLVPFSLKQLFSPQPLGILPVADLQPGRTGQVGIKFSLCNYTFEIALADKMEQLLTHALNVITVQQTFTVRWDQALGTHRPSAAYAPRMQRIRLPSAEVMRSRIAAYGPRFSSGHSMVEFYAYKYLSGRRCAVLSALCAVRLVRRFFARIKGCCLLCQFAG